VSAWSWTSCTCPAKGARLSHTTHTHETHETHDTHDTRHSRPKPPFRTTHTQNREALAGTEMRTFTLMPSRGFGDDASEMHYRTAESQFHRCRTPRPRRIAAHAPALGVATPHDAWGELFQAVRGNDRGEGDAGGLHRESAVGQEL
jgi:hypothetical protein